jgi:spore germination protein D
LSSTNYRKRIVTIMQESLQSPMIKLQMYELLRQAVREELNPKNVSGAKKQEGQEGGGESGESEGEDSGEAEAGEGDAEGS